MDKKYFIYEGEKQSLISFPLGGIGTGSIGLAGNGTFKDWEIFNRPNKNSRLHLAFFCIKTEQGKRKDIRILRGPKTTPFMEISSQFGKGQYNDMCGYPYFKKCTFRGEFPLAEIKFSDREVPVEVTLEAYNPFIPGDSESSSIPGAVFKYRVKNTSSRKVKVTLVGSLPNEVAGDKKYNKYQHKQGLHLIKLANGQFPKDDPSCGNMVLALEAEDISRATYWYKGGWFEPQQVFFRELWEKDRLTDRNYGKTSGKIVCSLAAHFNLRPKEEKELRFYLTWYFPNFQKFWHHEEQKPVWKNYYASQFKDAAEVALKLHKDQDYLYSETIKFKEALFSSTLPNYVLDAISSQISILKTPTCLRLEDGTFYGFEGCNQASGCCEGSCTHVWNYAHALPFLFPDLERSMREVDYKYNLAPEGKMCFRLTLPLSKKAGCRQLPAADGQMGGIIKIYRDYKIWGDGKWLKKLWPAVKKSLDFAFKEWDKDKDGVMEGRQHNTYDIELYGPNPMMQTCYLGALRAGSELAQLMGENKLSKKYEGLFKKGSSWMDKNLFNGEFYIQKIDQKAKTDTRDPETGQIKYQFGPGCLSDQLLGQSMAEAAGLGRLLSERNIQKALKSIYKYNFKKSLRKHMNNMRVYALQDEKGLLLCSWPKGKQPKIYLVYADECWPGIEYQVASHLIGEGLLEEGLEIVKGVRERFDGKKRNPWNEFECGSNYARSMASYMLLLALSGFRYDMSRDYISFAPQLNQENFKTFFGVGGGWGTYQQKKKGNRVEIILVVGRTPLGIKEIEIPFKITKTKAIEEPEGIKVKAVNNLIKISGRLKSNHRIRVIGSI